MVSWFGSMRPSTSIENCLVRVLYFTTLPMKKFDAGGGVNTGPLPNMVTKETLPRPSLVHPVTWLKSGASITENDLPCTLSSLPDSSPTNRPPSALTTHVGTASVGNAPGGESNRVGS